MRLNYWPVTEKGLSGNIDHIFEWANFVRKSSIIKNLYRMQKPFHSFQLTGMYPFKHEVNGFHVSTWPHTAVLLSYFSLHRNTRCDGRLHVHIISCMHGPGPPGQQLAQRRHKSCYN